MHMGLTVNNLEVTIERRCGTAVRPVRGVSLRVEPGRTLALVGESGCGKSMSGLAIAGLLPRRARISAGSIEFEGATRAEADREAIRLLGRVGLPDPERRAREYPHQFSGGMNQRAMIALAVAGNPRVLIADEATTALDVTLQAQIIDLISDLRDSLGTAVLFVTLDLGLVAQSADDVAVMYAGRMAEIAPVARLFTAPRHPYTQGLLSALPGATGHSVRLTTIDGTVPPIDALPQGCAFAPRCGKASALCRDVDPTVHAGVACHHVLPAPVKTKRVFA